MSTFEYCQHVYRNVGQNPCQFCGGETHEIDWDKAKLERKAHIEKHGLFNNTREWWSI